MLADVTHVDYLANLQIASAWHMNKYAVNQLKFFNMSSTNMVPMKSVRWLRIRKAITVCSRFGSG